MIKRFVSILGILAFLMVLAAPAMAAPAPKPVALAAGNGVTSC